MRQRLRDMGIGAGVIAMVLAFCMGVALYRQVQTDHDRLDQMEQRHNALIRALVEGGIVRVNRENLPPPTPPGTVPVEAPATTTTTTLPARQ